MQTIRRFNMKRCTICNETKDLLEFDSYKNKSGAKLPTPRCKACRRKYVQDYNKRKFSSKTGLSREQWLDTVRKPKLSPEEKQNLGQAKWNAWHKEWLESGAIEKYRAIAERKRTERLQSGVKECTKCKKELPISQFHMRTRKRKDGSRYSLPYSICKTCRRTDNKKHEQTPTGKATKKRNRVLRDRRNRQATPSWLTFEQKQDIATIYEHMRDCRSVTGEDYHVDHIVPLKGETVCGLHVPWNLQVMPAYVNMSKSNSLDDTPYGPLEQVP